LRLARWLPRHYFAWLGLQIILSVDSLFFSSLQRPAFISQEAFLLILALTSPQAKLAEYSIFLPSYISSLIPHTPMGVELSYSFLTIQFLYLVAAT